MTDPAFITLGQRRIASQRFQAMRRGKEIK